MHHQRAKGRNRLDHTQESARAQARIEAQDFGAERRVDPVAELDDEGAVAGREEAHGHRVP